MSDLTLNDLLLGKHIDPQHVLVLRHRPRERGVNKVFPWLAADKPELFNAYQQTQRGDVERVMRAMVGSGYVASFIGREPGKALFIGLYSIAGASSLSYENFWEIPANMELRTFGMEWYPVEAWPVSVSWFDLVPHTDFYPHWKGRLVVVWPGREFNWWRRAHLNEMPVLSILEDSALDTSMPAWNKIELTWDELGVLPTRWRSALSHWRGIYLIFDTSDGKGYVGSAYGQENLLGRWRNYAAQGHGGNRLLRQRDPRKFLFTILERVSPDMDAGDVTQLEASWKQRLHTRDPFGLNDN